MDDKVMIYLLGTAGSGKSTLANRLGEWLTEKGGSVVRVNLDPGADTLPYSPDLDVREWVDLYDIMAKYELGPNGAQIASADNIALLADKIEQGVDEVNADYVLVDTPGQIELFAYRNSSKVIIRALGPTRSQFVFLIDPYLANTPVDYISQQLLYITCQLRFGIPSVNLLSKCDMMEDGAIERIIEWSRDRDALYSAAMDEATSLGGQFHMELLRSIMHMELTTPVFRCSSETGEGMADIYNTVQQVYSGGEDIGT